MFFSTTTVLTLLIASLCVLAAAITNGAADPVSQAVATLQAGTTLDRRQAAEHLARIGDQRAVQPLTQALRDDDQLVREASEQALWRIWHRSGTPEVDARLLDGITEMHRGAWQDAVGIFSEVIEVAPDFAEGYNKRATTYYLMQEYEKSILDCETTISLNPVHFGALSGAGLNYLGLRNPVKALAYFERAVRVNPNMPQIRNYIKTIKNFLRDETL